MLTVAYGSPLGEARFDAIESFLLANSDRRAEYGATQKKNLERLVALHRAEVFGVDRLDANETALVAEALEWKSGIVQEIQRPGLKARTFVPMEDTVPTGAKSYTYEVWDGTGMAQLIVNYGDDVALVGVKAGEETAKLVHYGLGYEVTLEDLEAAAFSGMPIQTRKAQEVIRGFESRLELVAALGDSDAGFTGLFNHPNLPIISAAAPGTGSTTTWLASSDKTAEEILGDMNTLVDTVGDNTKGAEEPDTLIVPRTRWRFIQKTPVETGTGGDRRTILQEFQNRNPGIEVGWWHQADTASAADGPAALCYQRSLRAVKMEVQEARSLAPFQKTSMVQQFDSRARYGAVEYRLPLSGVRMDGV